MFKNVQKLTKPTATDHMSVLSMECVSLNLLLTLIIRCVHNNCSITTKSKRPTTFHSGDILVLFCYIYKCKKTVVL